MKIIKTTKDKKKNWRRLEKYLSLQRQAEDEVNLNKTAHHVAMCIVFQALAKVFPGKSHDADAILRLQILPQIVAAEIEDAENA